MNLSRAICWVPGFGVPVPPECDWFTIVNDFSARDMQMKTPQWMLGKISDDFVQ